MESFPGGERSARLSDKDSPTRSSSHTHPFGLGCVDVGRTSAGGILIGSLWEGARASPESTVPHPIALLELTSLSSTQELKQMCGRCEECGGEGKDGAGVRAPHPHFRALPPHHLLSPLTTLVLWVVGAKLWLGGDGMGRSCTGRCGRALSLPLITMWTG